MTTVALAASRAGAPARFDLLFLALALAATAILIALVLLDGAPASAALILGGFGLGIAVDQPDKSMPDVQTFRSLGYDVFAATHTGIVAPAGVPPQVVDKLTKAIKKVIDSPEHQKKLEEMGVPPAYLDPQAYEKIWVATETSVKPLLESLVEKK